MGSGSRRTVRSIGTDAAAPPHRPGPHDRPSDRGRARSPSGRTRPRRGRADARLAGGHRAPGGRRGDRLRRHHRLRRPGRRADRARRRPRSCSATWSARTPPASATRWPTTSCGPCCCCAPTRWPSGSPASASRSSSCSSAMLNGAVHPVIPSRGSLGASGDLAPLAHLALVVIGEGEASVDGAGPGPGATALERAGLAPLALEAKEGLALLNGTQLMAGIGSLAHHDALRLAISADVIGAMSLEAMLGTGAAFDDAPHPGPAASGPARVRPASPRAARRQRDLGVASGRHRAPRAGRVQPALHAAGPRRSARRVGRAGARAGAWS